MDAFVIKKPKITPEGNTNRENSEERDSQLASTSGNLGTKSKTAAAPKYRQYSDSHLEMGFTWCGEESCPQPECIICGRKLANEALVPSKLKRHFTTNHSNLVGKKSEYFKTLLDFQKRQTTKSSKTFKVSERAQEASYLVAELVAKQMKPHTIAENLILPATCKIVNKLFGPEAEKEVLKIPLSDSTISRRIGDMSKDIEILVTKTLKMTNMFAIQVDESTDISGKAQLLEFVRFINEQNIEERFLCCKELKETTHGQDVFDVLTAYLESVSLSWNACVGVCTDGAPSMTGSMKGFVSLIKQQHPGIISTHCFLHKEALVAKTLAPEFKDVLSQVVQIVNYIKHRPLKSRLFAKLCESCDSDHVRLILHTEVRWLSRANVLSRVYELREEIHTFLTLEKHELCEFLSCEFWICKLAYLADIFQVLNKLNLSMQGKTENILSSDKLQSFKEKLCLWKKRVSEGDLEMFPLTFARKNKEIIKQISDHLATLEQKIERYFPNLNVVLYDWIRNPFSELANRSDGQFSLQEEEELIAIRHDRSLEIKYHELSLDTFWIIVSGEHHNIGRKALAILLQFSTTYLCELAFSSMTNIKTQKRERLLSLEDELRVCLSSIRPRIDKLCRLKQAQVSH
ncbi:zinc finger BED domain-containing protein 5-like [Rhinophrynus dorsalis]